MKLKRTFSTKRCLLFWAFLVGLTVLFQNAIVILVSICSKGSCCLKLGEVESYPSRKFGKCYLYCFCYFSKCDLNVKFSLKDLCNFNQTGDENKKSHQLAVLRIFSKYTVY